MSLARPVSSTCTSDFSITQKKTETQNLSHSDYPILALMPMVSTPVRTELGSYFRFIDTGQSPLPSSSEFENDVMEAERKHLREQGLSKEVVNWLPKTESSQQIGHILGFGKSLRLGQSKDVTNLHHQFQISCLFFNHDTRKD